MKFSLLKQIIGLCFFMIYNAHAQSNFLINKKPVKVNENVDYKIINSLEVIYKGKPKTVSSNGVLSVRVYVYGINENGKSSEIARYRKTLEGTQTINDFIIKNIGKNLMIWNDKDGNSDFTNSSDGDRAPRFKEFCEQTVSSQKYASLRLEFSMEYFEKIGYEKWSTSPIMILPEVISANINLGVDASNIILPGLGVKFPKKISDNYVVYESITKIEPNNYKNKFNEGLNIADKNNTFKTVFSYNENLIYSTLTKVTVPNEFTQDQYILYLKSSHSNYIRNISNDRNPKVAKKYPLDSLLWYYYTGIKLNGNYPYIMSSVVESKTNPGTNVILSEDINQNDKGGSILLNSVTSGSDSNKSESWHYTLLLKNIKNKNEIILVNFNASTKGDKNLEIVTSFVSQLTFLN